MDLFFHDKAMDLYPFHSKAMNLYVNSFFTVKQRIFTIFYHNKATNLYIFFTVKQRIYILDSKRNAYFSVPN